MNDKIDQGIPVVLLWLDEGIEPSPEMFEAAAQDLTHGPEIWPQFDQEFRKRGAAIEHGMSPLQSHFIFAVSLFLFTSFPRRQE